MHRGVRHPFGVRERLSLRPDRGDGRQARPGHRRDRGGRARSARRGFSHFRCLCRPVPPRLRRADRRDRADGAGEGDRTMTDAPPSAAPGRLAAFGDSMTVLRWLLPALVLAGLLLLWEWWVQSGLAPPIIVPAPSRIWQSFFEDWDKLGPAFASTMLTTLEGF